MAKAKAMVIKRESLKGRTTVPGIVAKRARRRPYEYDHQYGLRVEAPTKASRGAASPVGMSPRRAKAAKVKRPAKKR
jgi:hypothetical protein